MVGKQKFWDFYTYQDLIRSYDLQGNLLLEIVLDDDEKNVTMQNVDDRNLNYYKAKWNSKYIAVLYNAFFSADEFYKFSKDERKRELQLWTWDGELKRRIYFDVPYDIYALSEDNIFYAMNMDKPDVIYTYDLNESRFSAYLMVAMVVLFFCSCDGKKDKTLRELKDVSGCQVKFPDVPLFRGTKSKILVLVADTGECSPCSMGGERMVCVSFGHGRTAFGCRYSICLAGRHALAFGCGFPYCYNMGCTGIMAMRPFMKLNPVFKQVHYSTFLISPKRKVVLIGSPLDSPKLWRGI